MDKELLEIAETYVFFFISGNLFNDRIGNFFHQVRITTEYLCTISCH